MVAEFPVFSKVTLEDKSFFDEFNAQFPPYADWAFGTLMTWWNAFDDLEASRLSGNLVIKSSYLSMGKVPMLVLLGNRNIDSAMATLFAYQAQHNMRQELLSIPRYTIEAISDPQRYHIVEDPDTSEYIFSAKMHATLEGSEMAHVRWRVSQFNRSMEGHQVEIRSIPLEALPAKLLLINNLHTWQQGIYKNDNERIEGAVIDRALVIAEDIGLHSLCLFIDKELEGFALYKLLPEKHANVNHVKVSYRYPNIFRYMLNILATHLQDEGINFLNGEQDLGIEGLRIYKSSLRPVHQLKKYNIYPKS